MGILEQLEQQGFRVVDGRRRLLAQLALGRTVFVKDVEGHGYRITTAPGRIVTLEMVSDVKDDLFDTVVLAPFNP